MSDRNKRGQFIPGNRLHRRNTIAQFLNRIDKRGPNECREWRGGKNGKTRINSYGILWMGGKKHKTHRLSFEYFVRPLVAGEIVCHKCDNPPCCNPSHLFAGSHKDNIHDCISKGRYRKEHGEDRYNSKLTEKDVREIRFLYVPRKVGCHQLAKRFGVVPTMIHAIVKRKRWKHVI